MFQVLVRTGPETIIPPIRFIGEGKEFDECQHQYHAVFRNFIELKGEGEEKEEKNQITNWLSPPQSTELIVWPGSSIHHFFFTRFITLFHFETGKKTWNFF